MRRQLYVDDILYPSISRAAVVNGWDPNRLVHAIAKGQRRYKGHDVRLKDEGEVIRQADIEELAIPLHFARIDEYLRKKPRMHYGSLMRVEVMR